ncbi:uncharacterized protein LOC111704730 isoform X2 [Eurytemora carolleeae]|uniref:uncharacterized protein LOC111704730 isoform X2 n=1 Tax=Eurytemora carolleeae TaxID=1294199 RepID=UPI000C75C1B0|nr:uncharacterized protein LOC111704730 isoform X2 [Eurytemora carolleeae]|eukprot:XP_023332827.1 uncharacterized protein LOC111704730 isoform X2 [Eurytemora affinis]
MPPQSSNMEMNTTENMNNTAENVGRSLTSLISKINTDQSDLSKTLPSNTSYNVLHNSEAAVHYGQFYTLYLIIAILVFILIIMIYLHFFSWVLKGNLDLPGPGGMDVRKGPVVYVKNPFKMFYAWITRGPGTSLPDGARSKKAMFESKRLSENIKQHSQFRYGRHLDDVEEMIIE